MTDKTPDPCGSGSSTELVLLPIGPHDHPEPRTMMWSALELAAIKEYAARCVAAERDRLTLLVRLVREVQEANASAPVRLLTARQELAWRALDDELLTSTTPEA